MTDVIVAPFSNSDIRDWPVESYAAMVRCLLERLPPTQNIRVIGTPSQKLRVCDVVRDLPSTRVFNDCGLLSWGELLYELKRAACIIGNNSGVAHLGGYFGVPTVCVFGGSHQRHEWRPLGSSVVLVSRVIGCSPCQLDHGQNSPYGKACLREIEPERVADAAFMIMGHVAEARLAGASVDGSS